MELLLLILMAPLAILMLSILLWTKDTDKDSDEN